MSDSDDLPKFTEEEKLDNFIRSVRSKTPFIPRENPDAESYVIDSIISIRSGSGAIVEERDGGGWNVKLNGYAIIPRELLERIIDRLTELKGME